VLVEVSAEGVELIKQFEELHLSAQSDREGELYIGYNHRGADICEGQLLHPEEAHTLLVEDARYYGRCVTTYVDPKLSQNEFDALVSFCFSIGSNAFLESSTLKLLNQGTKRSIVASELMREVPRKKSTGELCFFSSRRTAEKALFLRKPKHPLLGHSIYAKTETWLKRLPLEPDELQPEEKLFVPKGSAHEWASLTEYPGEKNKEVKLVSQPTQAWWINPSDWKVINDKDEAMEHLSPRGISLGVPYYPQRENGSDFSCCCAMLLAGLQPEMVGTQEDYYEEVQRRGDERQDITQLETLSSYGLDAEFCETGYWITVEELIEQGAPVPLGILHEGPLSCPSGSGHWICAVGLTEDRKSLICHDPWGYLSLKDGSYITEKGESVIYSKEELAPRWMAGGIGTGWFIRPTKKYLIDRKFRLLF